MSTIRDEVIAIINDVCRPETPELDDDSRSLLESGLDSLDFATLMMALEDKYGVAITEDDLEKMRSLNAIVAFIEARRAA
jgi:acyl carrier protein